MKRMQAQSPAFHHNAGRRSSERALWSTGQSQKGVVESMILHQKERIIRGRSRIRPVPSTSFSVPSSPSRDISQCLSGLQSSHLIHRDEPESAAFSFDRTSNGPLEGNCSNKQRSTPPQTDRLPDTDAMKQGRGSYRDGAGGSGKTLQVFKDDCGSVSAMKKKGNNNNNRVLFTLSHNATLVR